MRTVLLVVVLGLQVLNLLALLAVARWCRLVGRVVARLGLVFAMTHLPPGPLPPLGHDPDPDAAAGARRGVIDL